MDTERFDALARRLACGTSRRQVLKGLAGGALGMGAARVVAGRAEGQACADIGQSCGGATCCQGLSCNENNVCIAAAECAGLGGGCQANEQCCQGYVCGQNGTCIAAAECSGLGQGCQANDQCCEGYVCGDTKTCIAAAECAGLGQGCQADGHCCGDLVCGGTGVCAEAGGSAGTPGQANPSGPVTSLPNTGAGVTTSGRDGRVWLAALAGGAALLVGKRRRDRAVTDQD